MEKSIFNYDTNEIDVMDEISVKNNLLKYMDEEIKRLKATLDDFKSNYTWSDEVDKLKAELKTARDGIDDLNDVLKDMQEESIEQIEDNKKLQDKLQAVNDDYNNDHKVHNEYADGLLEEVNELKAELEKANDNNMRYSSLKEYKAEADEYFEHNPKAKEVYFYMITDYDMKDAESGDLMLNQDDAICSFINLQND